MPFLEVTADEKENLRKLLLESASVEWLLGLVLNKEGQLNPQLVNGICEWFIQTSIWETCSTDEC